MKKNHLLASFDFAFAGIAKAIRLSRNLKIHLTFFSLVVTCGLLFQVSLLEWLVLFLISAAVISAEIMNTAIEEACNVYDEKLSLPFGTTKVPRDMAAAAVLVLATTSVLVGLLIFGPKLWRLLV